MGYIQKVVVIGAGISGLACAYRLKQQGIPCLLAEAQERAGGLISTIRRNGFLFETGPQCPRFPPSVWQLVRELGLDSEFVAGDPAAKRYIVRDGRLHRAPFSPGGLIGTRLVGLRSKLKILTEVFGSSRPAASEETLADFVQRKFGAEVLDYLVDPIISTVFFGDSHKMGMESAFPALVEWERKQGSLARGAIRAWKSGQPAPSQDTSPQQARTRSKSETLRVTDALPSLGSFRSGMAALPERLSSELREEIRYGAAIACVEQVGNECSPSKPGWQLGLSSGEKLAAEHLILAVPAHVAAQLLAKAAPQLASSLRAIEYAPICAVASAYNRSQVANKLDGFGFMLPRREGTETICTFWNSSMFPGRAPEDKVLVTSFAGRGRNNHGVGISEDEYARVVEAENAKILGIKGPPLDRVVWKDSSALPQYNVGHAQRVMEIQNIVSALPNLWIVGNFLKGRSIGDCVDLAFTAAEDIHSRIRSENI
ncbi:MAG TPA: protoporphyrinogen oxidase [Candidatus Acidoferrum sp.]|nr:protoporphyrinogen oxidase [Candidatus Acidoferrum sp.]